jgi:hypothetical protein
MHSTVGSAAQRIGADDVVSAEVVMYDYGQPSTWSASGSRGSGTFRLTSLTAESAAGTFRVCGAVNHPVGGRDDIPHNERYVQRANYASLRRRSVLGLAAHGSTEASGSVPPTR